MLVNVSNKTTEYVVSALIKHSKKLPAELYKSLTWDRGCEMSDHSRFSLATNINVYFYDPSSPCKVAQIKTQMVYLDSIFLSE